MYALWTNFTLGPGMRETADKLGEGFAPILAALKGFKSATFIRDETAGECAALSLWETKADAEAALADTEAGVKEQISGIATGPVTRKVFKVWRVVEADK